MHQFVVEFDKLLHLLECVTSHLGLVPHLVLHSLLLSVLVAGDESLVLTGQKHNSLFRLHFGLKLCLVEGIDLVTLQGEVDSNEVSQLLN